MPYFIDDLRSTEDNPKPRTYYCGEQELLGIANRIREAGGANAIDAFFPSEQGDIRTCLIATSLNFKCKVTEWPYEFSYGPLSRLRLRDYWPSFCRKWVMIVPTVERAKQLGGAMGWDIIDVVGYRNYLILPEKVGNTAAAFDEGKGWTKKYVKTLEMT